MKPRRILDSVSTHDGRLLSLYQRDQSFMLEVDGEPLMSSRFHGSEEALAHTVIARLDGISAPRVMIGGLGMGFTLRAALDALAEKPLAAIEVVEIFSVVVQWNRGVLAHLAGRPLDDPRVTIKVADVGDLLRQSQGRWDAILLDVDNGPDAFSLDSNLHIYTRKGLAHLRGALRPHGILGIWSAFDDDRFAGSIRKAGFEVETRRVRARSGAEGGNGKHVLFLAKRS